MHNTVYRSICLIYTQMLAVYRCTSYSPFTHSSISCFSTLFPSWNTSPTYVPACLAASCRSTRAPLSVMSSCLPGLIILFFLLNKSTELCFHSISVRSGALFLSRGSRYLSGPSATVCVHSERKYKCFMYHYDLSEVKPFSVILLSVSLIQMC